MQDANIKMLAAIAAEWAAGFPTIKTVYIFGSRVRGDHHAGSDLDVGLDIDYSQATSEITLFDKEHPNYNGLKTLLPDGIILHVHLRMNEPVWPAILTGECVHQNGKVQCVITPTKHRS